MHHCLDIIPFGETALLFHLSQSLGGEIVPSELARELVPNHLVNFVQAPPVLVAPFEDFLVRAAFENPLLKFRIIDVQEPAAPLVGAFAEIGVKVSAQFASRVQSDFVEHPREVAQATD